MNIVCVAVPRHQRQGRYGCEECAQALVSAVREQSTPREAVEHFSAAAREAREEIRRRQRWWVRKDPAEPGRDFAFALAAKEVSAIEAFRVESPRERGFPTRQAYETFKKDELGFVGSPAFLSYYETMALLAGYPSAYAIGPDPSVIEMLEQHRKTIWDSVPENVQRVLHNHAKDDYNRWGRIPGEPVQQLGSWIAEHGQLPLPVVTYRQESRAYLLDRQWWDRLLALAPGDTISWDDRPVSTSVDPGFTRQGAPGLGAGEEWSPENRNVHFIITATKGFYLGSATTMQFNEHELILKPGQLYRVAGFRQHSTQDMLGRRYGAGHRVYIVLEEEPGA